MPDLRNRLKRGTCSAVHTLGVALARHGGFRLLSLEEFIYISQIASNKMQQRRQMMANERAAQIDCALSQGSKLDFNIPRW